MIGMLYYASLQITYYLAKLVPASQADCDAAKASTAFFGLPTWYKYLPYTYNEITAGGTSVKDCRITVDFGSNPQSIVLIGFAAIEILLRIAGMVAIGFVIYGGVQYVISQGEPDRVTSAKNTVVNALIGLALAIIASPFVAFLGNRFS